MNWLCTNMARKKLDMWTRNDQRENELLRARKAQAAHDAECTVAPDEWRIELAMAELCRFLFHQDLWKRVWSGGRRGSNLSNTGQYGH